MQSRFHRALILGGILLLKLWIPHPSHAWHDETHIAIARAAGYYKWFNATGADMAKLKAGELEVHNHFVNNPKTATVTPAMVFAQIEKYNRIDPFGHLYGAIIASLRDYQKKVLEGKYGEYHLGFCAHYVGDLSQPLHNTEYNDFNRTHHQTFDGIINGEVLLNPDKIRIEKIVIRSEADLAREIARIAEDARKLGYRLEAENRILTPEEAYRQIGKSASLFRGILNYLKVPIVPFSR